MTFRTVLASGRDERMRAPALVVACAAATVAAIVAAASTSESLVIAVVLGAGIVVGELFVLRWPPAGEVPASYAVFLVLARGAGVRDALLTVLAAELLTVAGDHELRAAAWRAGRGIAVGSTTIVAYHLGFMALGRHEVVVAVMAALLVGAAAGAGVDGSVRHAEGEAPQTFWPERALYAWGAIVGSGVLMAMAIRGVHGDGALGLRAAMLLALPLLAIWWSYQQDDAATRVLRQTVDALAMVPVLSGAVELGASARDAELARHVAAHVGLTPDEQYTIAVAARLRHLGAVASGSLIAGAGDVDAVGFPRAETATAAMLRGTPFAESGTIADSAAGVEGGASPPASRAEMHATVLRMLAEFQSARTDACDSASAIGALTCPARRPIGARRRRRARAGGRQRRAGLTAVRSGVARAPARRPQAA